MGMSTIGKRVVYKLRSDTNPSQSYIGLTSDMNQRLQWHNHGPTGHTLRYRPWSLLVAVEFRTEAAARRFEKYLKSGSGRAFAKRHLDPDTSEH